MTTAGASDPDLREERHWREWVALLPEADRELLESAAMHFTPALDTLLLLFPNTAERLLTQERFERLIEAIDCYYKVRRVEWLLQFGDPETAGTPPVSAMTPRVVIEVAPPTSRNH